MLKAGENLATTPPLTKSGNRGQFYLLITAGTIFTAGLVALAVLGDLTRYAGWLMLIYAGLFGTYLLVSLKLANLAVNNTSRWLVAALFLAVLFRLVAIAIPPSLSTDSFRYIWEGKLVTAGVSPYQYPPDDAALQPYRANSSGAAAIWPIVAQRETASPYPPLSQAIGTLMYLVFGESLLGPKIVAVFFDLLIILALLWLLKLFQLPLNRVLLYAWCPLPVLEFGQGGHNDAPMLLLLLVAVGLASKKLPVASAVTLGLACLAKFTPLFGLGAMLVSWRVDRDWSFVKFIRSPRQWLYPLITLAIIVVGYLPFLVLGNGALGSLLEYTGSWLDNESPFFRFFYYNGGLTLAKTLSLLVLVIAIWFITFYPPLALGLSLPRRLSLSFGVTLLVASTVHVWYLTWLLVLLPLVWHTEKQPFFRFWDVAWLSFALLSPLSYLSYSGDGKPLEWVRWVEYLPLHLLLAAGIWYAWRSKQVGKGAYRVKNAS